MRSLLQVPTVLPCLSRLTATLAILCLAGSCSAKEPETRIDPRVDALYGGAEAIAVLQGPERVQAWRIEGSPRQPKPEDDPTKLLHGYGVLAGPAAVDEATGKQLAGLLLQPASYEFESAKGCEFQPGVLLRFSRSKANLDILICYSCNEISIYFNGKQVGHEDIDRIRKPMVAAAQRAFPQDEAIRQLTP